MLGFCWQGALLPKSNSPLRIGITLGLLIGLTAFPFLLNLASGFLLVAPGISGGMVAYVAGCLVGIVAYWLFGRSFVFKPDFFTHSGLLWAILTWALIIFFLLPLESLGWLTADGSAGWLGGYPGEVAQHYYSLIKTAMLWVPVGVVFVLLERQALLRIWAVAALISYFLVALGLPDAELQWRDTLELLCAFPGIAAGIWLAERTFSTALSMQALASGKATEPRKKMHQQSIASQPSSLANGGKKTTASNLADRTGQSIRHRSHKHARSSSLCWFC